MRRFWGLTTVGGLLGGILLVGGCFFSEGHLDPGADAGATGTMSYGLSGSDARFTWSPEKVIDRQKALAWNRHASEPKRWADAPAYCAELGMRVPTREELLEISDWFGTDLFPDTARHADWQWSSSPGSRSETAWAIGNAGYANSNDVEAKSLVRCVSSP